MIIVIIYLFICLRISALIANANIVSNEQTGFEESEVCQGSLYEIFFSMIFFFIGFEDRSTNMDIFISASAYLGKLVTQLFLTPSRAVKPSG